MSRLALAVSPHLDDAAFSCGGTLAILAARGWHVVVASVFTASVASPKGFALACQLDKGLSPDVDYMALRRAEDCEACRALGLEAPLWMPFREAPHRGYGSAAALFADPLDEDDIGASITGALARLIDDIGPDLLLAPQAVGGHVDHVQVARALPKAGTLPILWWTDFPYTLRSDTPRRPFATVMEGLPPLDVALDADAVAAKRAACAAYRSQIGFQFGGLAGLDRRLAEAGEVERFHCFGEPVRI